MTPAKTPWSYLFGQFGVYCGVDEGRDTHPNRVMSVAQATVTQKVSHPPVMPKYGAQVTEVGILRQMLYTVYMHIMGGNGQ